MQLEFLTPEDDRWTTFLREVPHDFYHLPGYLDLTARQEEGRAEAVLATAGNSYFFLPYIVRHLSDVPGENTDGLGDVCSPYGYPGPLVREGTPGFLRGVVGQWVAAMTERQITSGFFRFHPLFPVPPEAFTAFGSLTFRGQTVSIDLSMSEEAIWEEFRHGHKENIKRARKGGLLVAMHHDGRALEEFVAIYEETMHRVGAAAGYFFPASYFQELSAVLGERLWICIVRLPCGEAVAGSLLIQSGPIVQYHLGGTRTRALALAPIKLLHDFVWRYAKAHGSQVLHLGGGVGSTSDSLFDFKAGFSDRRHPFSTWEVVFLDDVYRSLTARRQEMKPATMRPGYFPAYRA